jgi:serine/threonine-protein kinase
MQFELGKTIGGYEFIDVLETTRSYRAYKVRNVLAQRLERLKTFPKDLQDDQERLERFLREIKIHAGLSHPNIATFYNATQIEGQLVMTTELIEGMTLAERLEGGALPWPEALNYMGQALAGLDYAHGRGVVHRMLAPANITITPDGTVKLTGFDIAKTARDPQLTQVGTVMGSLEYMSPEQVKGVGELDARCDIYSLGAVLYAAVAGRPPFQGKSQFDVMLAQVNTPPTPPIEVRPDLPPALNQIILKALAKDATQRFQTAAEFRDALESLKPSSQRAAKAAPALPPLGRTGATAAAAARALVEGPSWYSPRMILAGVFMFLIVAVAFFAFLRLSGF